MHHRRFLFSPKSVQEETDKAEHIFDISHFAHVLYIHPLVRNIESCVVCTDCRGADFSETKGKRSEKRKTSKGYTKQCLKGSHLDKEAGIAFMYQRLEK